MDTARVTDPAQFPPAAPARPAGTPKWVWALVVPLAVVLVVVAALLIVRTVNRTSVGGGDTNIRLQVYSDGETVDITYGILGQSSQELGAAVPWIRNAPLSEDAAKLAGMFSVVAQADSDASYISCEIIVGTRTISENRSTGAYSVVTC